MRSRLYFAAAFLAAWPALAANAPELKYVAIVTRHGVRSPTWDNARLNRYSAEPWPEWGITPGILTTHGRKLIELMGAYYREWLAGEHLLGHEGCRDAGRIYIRADKDQRTIETGHALAESLLPGCEIPVHAEPAGAVDPLFAGAGKPDPERSLSAVRERLGSDPQKLLRDHAEALATIQFILHGGQAPSGKPVEPAGGIGVGITGGSVDLTGPFANDSTFAENLLLEYTNGMRGAELGWGRLNRDNLYRVLELHAVYDDLMRRTPYIARARASNLLAHVLGSLEQAVSGRSAPMAVGPPGNGILVLSGHDSNLSNLSGMLGITWRLPGYYANDTPPGGALIFSLWRDPGSGRYSVKLRYLAQTLDQIRDGTPMSVASPPESQDIPLPGCKAVGDGGCPWADARALMQKALDPQFVAAGDGAR